VAEVDFYVLEGGGPDAPGRLLCRRVERARAEDLTVYIHADSSSAAREVDRLLWSHRQEGFLAHELYREGAEPPLAPVRIGHGEPVPAAGEVLVNLASGIPEGYGAYPRVLEVVAADPEARAAGRERYRHYRERGETLRHHPV
jgi:DNA polymerase-3 subunit chi